MRKGMDKEVDRSAFVKSFLDIGARLTQELDIGRVLIAIVEQSMELTGARYGAALTLTPEGHVDDFLYRGMTPEEVARLPHLPEGKGLLGVVLVERRPVRIDDLAQHPDSVGFPDRHVPMAAFLGVPLIQRNKLVGALYLTKPPGDPLFEEEDENLTQALASMAAVGIENARLFAAESERAERSALLGQISHKVRSSLSVHDVLTATVETLGPAAKVDRCFIRMATGEGPALGPIEYEWKAAGVASLRGDRERQYPVGSLAALTSTTQWSDDVTLDYRLYDPSLPGTTEDLVRKGVRAVIASPIEWGGDLMGIIAFHSKTPRRWSHSDRLLIEAAAREVAVALDHAGLYGQAVDSATRLKEVDERRSDFVSMMTHEVRSPMTVVAGIADLLDKRGDDIPADKKDRMIQTLGREARRLTKLVTEVLQVEGVERGAVTLELSKVDLAELAHESVIDGGHFERADVVVDGSDATVDADRDRIKQVLLNLLANAAKFSREDARIKVTVASEENTVAVHVKDSGPGIAPEDRERLFRPFSRIGSSSPESGTGMGLYLCKTIIDRHGGEIEVDSCEGDGCTFSFRLPR